MPSGSMIRFAVAAAALVLSLPGLAQTADFDVLVDTDRSAATGCSVTPTGGAALDGFEHRIRASVNLATFQVDALERSSCDGGVFGAPVTVSGFSTPYPLALNAGIAGADAVELAVARAALGATNLSRLRLAFVTDNGAGSDTLASADGAGGGPIVLGLPVQIPALSVWGLGALVLVLLGLAFVAQRRMGRVGAVMAVMLVTTAAWAMTFALDGDLSDWGGRAPNATDPGGDATDGSAAIDLVAGFVVLDGDDLFFRMDVADTENQVPVALDDAFSTDEDAPLNVAAPGVLANDSDGDMDPITAVLDAGPGNAQAFTLNPDGSFDYTPDADFNGSDSFTYFADDGQGLSAAATVDITINAVNDPPVALGDTANTDEDTQVDIDVLANDSDSDGNLDPASVTVTTAPSNGSTGVNPVTGVITYTKSGDFSGADSFEYQVCDDGTPLPAECATATVAVTVNDVNDAPGFTAGPNQTVNEDAGAQTVVAWATGISAGPANESSQVLTFNVTGNTNPGLFSAGPAVDPVSGDLTFTPTADASGSAAITLTLSDNGGTANGGVDTSAPANFTITVDPVNDAPSFVAGANVQVLEDSGAYDQPWATGLSAGPADESGQVLTFNITSNDNPGLFAAGPAIDAGTGNLGFTPAANASGTANLTVELMDDGGTANGGVDTSASVNLVITVAGVNDAPSFTAGGDQAVDEDSGAQTVNAWAAGISAGPADESGQTLTFVLTEDSRDATLTFSAAPTIDPVTGNLAYTPAADAYGSADYSVVLTDNGGTANGGVDSFGPVSLTITVNAINDPPTVAVAPSYAATTNIRIDVPAGSGLLSGAADEATEASDPNGPASPGTTLAVGNGMNPAPTTSTQGGSLSIFADGSFSYNPPAGFTGSDDFSYVVCDDGIPGPSCSAPVTVTLTVSGPTVWFVDNSVSGGGNDGRLASPFESLAAFNGSMLPGTGDFIFLATGSGGYSDGANAVTLADNQTLFGQGTTGTTFDAFTGITAAPNSVARPTLGGTPPVIEAANNGILVSTSAGNSNTLRGFNIGNTPGGAGITGLIPGTLNVSEVNITGTGGLLSLNGSTTGTLNASFGALSSTSATTAWAFEVLNMAGGSLTSASTTITTPGQNAISIIETPTMQFNFGNLSNVLTSTGAGIVTTNPGTVTISPPAPVTVQTVGGPALNLSGGTYNGFNFSSLSANSTVNGIVLNNTAGFISCGGGNIQNTTGDAVVITGGSNSITLGTFITNNAGRAVVVTGHGGGNVVFNQITDTAQGVFLDNNAGTTFFFSGTMNLNTGANDGFTATNGGSLDVTGMGGVVTTTTGTPVTIDGVSIRNTGVSFQSVSANGAPNGIVLANTGTAGFFLVNGDGTNARNGSGGTIRNTTGDGVLLTNAHNVTLRQMNLVDIGDTANPGDIVAASNDHAIESRGGGDIRLSAVTIESPLGSGWEAFDITGVNAIDTDSLVTGLDLVSNFAGIRVTNANTNFTSFSILDSTVDHADPTPGDAATNGNADVVIATTGTAGGSFVVDNSSFTGARGTAITVAAGNAPGSTGTLVTSITNSSFEVSHPINGQNNLGLQVLNGAVHNLTVDNNTLRDIGRGGSLSGQVIAQKSHAAVLDATVNGNAISEIVNQHGLDAVSVSNSNGGKVDWEADGNQVFDVGSRGVFVTARGSEPDMDIALRNNIIGTVANPVASNAGSAVQRGIDLDTQTNAFLQAVLANNTVVANTSGSTLGGLASSVMFINTEEFPNPAPGTAVTHATLSGNTFTNQNATGSPNVIARTRDEGLTLAVDYDGNVANGASSSVLMDEAATSTVTVEDLATVVGDNPGITTLTIPGSITDHGGNVPEPDF